MPSLRTLAYFTLTIALAGCLKKGSTGTAPPFTLTATMTSAVKAARARVSSSSSGVRLSAFASAPADGELVSVDINGGSARVFNASFPIYGMKSTTHYLIVAGAFTSSTAAGSTPVVDKSGLPINCYLYAISKTASGLPTDYICLSKTKVGDFDPSMAATNSHYAHLGFATSGTKVYFTDFASGSLYTWNEGDAAPAKTATVALGGVGDGADDVFADPNSSNVCVLVAALGPYSGQLLCGTQSSLGLTLAGTPGSMVLAETIQAGGKVLTTTKAIDLSTLAVSSRVTNGSNGGLPAGISNITADVNGGSVYIGYAWSLDMVTAAGATCVIASTNGMTNTGCAVAGQTVAAYFQTLIGLGNYAWTYGTSDAHDLTTGTQLRRIDLTSNQLDATNFMSAAGLTSISGMYLTPEGYIELTGKDASGAAATGVIDSNGNIASTQITMLDIDMVTAL